MTIPTPGRGRPLVFDPALQHSYLEHVASGVRLGDAAAMVGVDRRTPSRHAKTDHGFAARLDQAKQRGKQARHDALPHGDVSTYNNHRCRCGLCRKAATHARATHRDTTRGGEVVPMPTPGSPPEAAATPHPEGEMMAA